MNQTSIRSRPAMVQSHPIAATLTLELGIDGRLCAQLGNERRLVHVHRCFPWSEPEHFISLRDENGDEFVLVADPTQLDDRGRSLLQAALQEAGFIFDVIAVLALDEEIELRNWLVRTHQGTRRFQTRLDDWPRKLPAGGLLVRDVTGDFYRVADPARLDRRSRELLWAFVD